MADVPHPLPQARFGATVRRDAWWVQPAVVFLVLSAFIVYATWAAFQGEHYTYGPYLSPFYSPELFGDSPHALVRAEAGLVAGVAAVLAGAADPAVPGALPAHLLLLPRRLLQGVLGRPAGLRGRRAAQDATAASARSRSILQNVHRYFLYVALVFLRRAGARRLEGALVRRSGDRPDRVRHRRRHARAARSTSSCSAATRSAATRCATWSAGCLDRLSGRRCASVAYDCVELPQPPAHALGVVQPVLRSPSPTSTSGSARWASGPTGGSSDGRRTRRIEHDVLVIGAGGAGLRAAIEAVGRRRHGRPRLQVAARQGAHRDGRGRHRRGAGQRRRPRQLAGALRRHDARRPVRQQLAHGRAARARRRPTACASWRRGARCSTARRTAASCSATSAATAIRAWRTSATAPASR